MPKQLTELDIAARIAPASVRWPTNTIHWEKLAEAVAATRALVASVDASCRAVEQDCDLSLEGICRKRAELGRRAIRDLSDLKPVRSAKAAVSSAVSVFESGMVKLPKAPAGADEVALAQELRAFVLAQENPVGFVLNHLDDGRVVAAVLHAPGFLSGIDEVGLTVIRERSRSALHPDQVRNRKEAEEALETLDKGIAAARRMVLDRTETRIDQDGQVRHVREPVSGAV